MKYLAWIGVACVALVAASCAPTVYNSGTPTSSTTYDVTNFNGEWHLVDDRGDSGQNWIDEQNRYNFNDWGTTNSTPTTQRRGYMAWFLPDDFRIDGDRQFLRIEDNNGGLVTEIDLNNGYRYGSYNGQNDGPGTRARWLSDRRFEVDRVGRNGRRLTELFTLQNRGQQLVVNLQVERDGRTRSFTRVYDRV